MESLVNIIDFRLTIRVSTVIQSQHFCWSGRVKGHLLLATHLWVDEEQIGVLGHSYGGNTVLFHGALDARHT